MTPTGIYMRCSEPSNLTDRTCYEANIFDQRPDPTLGTGSIVHMKFRKVQIKPL